MPKFNFAKVLAKLIRTKELRLHLFLANASRFHTFFSLNGDKIDYNFLGTAIKFLLIDHHILRRTIDNLQNSEIGSVMDQAEGDFDNFFRQGDTSNFLEQSTQSEGSTKFLSGNQESENNSLENNDSYDARIGNLSHAINDFHRQIDIYGRTNVVGMKNHIRGLEMTNSDDTVD